MFRRTSVFDDFSNIFRSFDNLFRQSFGETWTMPLLTGDERKALTGPEPSFWQPSVETFTRKGKLILRAELPGTDPSDVEVTLENDRLVVRGEKKEEKRTEEDSFYMRELAYGRFERAFTLPQGVKPEDIKASFKNGVLEVSLPAKGAAPESRQIPIEAVKEKTVKVA